MNPEIVYVSFVHPINWDTINPLIKLSNEIVNSGTKQMYLLMGSTGGFVDAGFAVYNHLLGLPIKVTTHNIGSIDSVANVIFLAGSRRLACENSTFLFHGVHWAFPSGAEVRRPQIMEIMTSIQAAENKMRDAIVSRSSLTVEEVDAFFMEGAMKDAAFALSKKFIDEIKPVNIPTGAPILNA
ncbi:MAG: ATP-dependent Clp protease proteolytic subunit [Syntrophorhabdaceae bacterium]|nr:ATP-dependent Clp protease proteolytic subunit [Syntrophorhabdaceae bacterium]